MSVPVGMLIVHGMGTQRPDFAMPFERRLRRRLRALGLADDEVVCHAAHWADILQGREDALWGRLIAAHRLDWRWLRRFAVSALGDAIAYRSTPSDAAPTYQAIHTRLTAHLHALERRVGSPHAPLCLVGHSLGGVMLSDHVWDEQTRRDEHRPFPRGATPFTRCETLAGVVTFGTTLPLFTLSRQTVVPIKFPGPAASPGQRAAARWLNFYDRDDVLGYPLRATAYGYEHTVDADIPVRAGSWLWSWTPLSHTGYWTTRTVLRRTATLLRDLARA